MKRTRNGYTAKQLAYATRRLGGQHQTKKETALASGYAESVANSVMVRIENTEGYANAMAKLASDNGNLALKIYSELKNRDLSKENVPTLLSAIKTLADAWQVYTPKQKDSNTDNPLRAIILSQPTIKNAKIVENKTGDNSGDTV